MNNEYFLKKAEQLGLSAEATLELFKIAHGGHHHGMPPAGADPSAMPPGTAAPPADPSAGAPDIGAGGVPPEIEQLIQQLPPEVLAQLVQEIEAELGNGGAAAGGADASAAGPQTSSVDPSMMGAKQGSANDMLTVDHPAYHEEFVNSFRKLGFSLDESEYVFNKVASSIREEVSPENIKLAAYQDEFVSRARQYGLDDSQIVSMYNSVFGN